MNLSNISFPYPVLGSYDDVLPAPAEPKVEVMQDKENYYFDVVLEYDNKEIERLVANDFADYVCEVSCDTTKYRRCFRGKRLHFNLSIPRRSVAGKILFTCTITVKKTILGYTNREFHPDYLGHRFDMEPGDLLGLFSQFYYLADIKYDKLKAVGTFMEINETEDPLPQTVLDKEKIELKLPTELYNDFKDNPCVNSKVDILHASLVLHSLSYALCRIKHYEHRKWANTIAYRIDTEPELSEFKGLDPDEWEVDRLSQILLGNPYERLFNYLKNEHNQD